MNEEISSIEWAYKEEARGLDGPDSDSSKGPERMLRI